MIVIDQDPRQVIPNVCERDIDNKVFIITLELDYVCAYSAIIVNEFGILRVRGGHNTDQASKVYWLPYGNTLIDILINTWSHYISEFNVKICVLENTSDLKQLTCIRNPYVIKQARSILNGEQL